MSERIRGSYDDALYKSTYTLLYFTLLYLLYLLLLGHRALLIFDMAVTHRCGANTLTKAAFTPATNERKD